MMSPTPHMRLLLKNGSHATLVVTRPEAFHAA